MNPAPPVTMDLIFAIAAKIVFQIGDALRIFLFLALRALRRYGDAIFHSDSNRNPKIQLLHLHQALHLKID